MGADRTAVLGPEHPGALAAEQRCRAIAVDDGEHRTVLTSRGDRPSTGQQRHLDTAGHPGRQARFHGCACVIGVHMHRVRAGAPGGDGHRIPQRVQLCTQRVDGLGRRTGQQIHHLEPRRCRIGVRRLGHGGGSVGVTSGSGPRQDGGHRVQQYQQPPTTGVHHPRLGQHVELTGGAIQRDARRSGGGGNHIGDLRRGMCLGGFRRCALFCGFRRGGQHRDDGSRYRLPHRLDDQRLGATQRHREGRSVDLGETTLGRDIGETTQDLRQDHPRVPASAPQRAVGEQARQAHQVQVVAALGACDRGSHGEQHVGAGIGVGHREDIEAVDLVGMGDQVRDGGVGPTPQRRCVDPRSRHLHLPNNTPNRAGQNSHRR